MRAHLTVAVLAAVTVVLLAAPAFGRPALKYQINVTITNSSCVFQHSVSKSNTTIVFSLINNGGVAHGFDIWKFKSKLIKAHQQGTFTVKFPRSGAYKYACVAPHSTVKKGVFTIRNT